MYPITTNNNNYSWLLLVDYSSSGIVSSIQIGKNNKKVFVILYRRYKNSIARTYSLYYYLNLRES